MLAKLSFEQMTIKNLKDVRQGDMFKTQWYDPSDKAKNKYKLGRLSHSTVTLQNTDYKCIKREIDFERISAYVIENFQNRMIQLLQIDDIEKIWLKPIAYYIDKKLKVSLFYPVTKSLHHFIHEEK